MVDPFMVSLLEIGRFFTIADGKLGFFLLQNEEKYGKMLFEGGEHVR